ncbi:MAG: phosphatidate cytidylyltransferase [Alicyclobacillus macrosporangiidus]|uniref:phosphatidate cytidylyltransferase n=1 Tax=Alicyclobacillus macrosporangiidus TaxID=392015 RepID=UPI0026F3219A|nr:phosphatidate cytidylyltransferase [Alicyclobacillus macrosporangiidus]MCL6597337.1 phosphatidate cytidylyltransferase [Alicyclobacillus macrosporangiidus]
MLRQRVITGILAVVVVIAIVVWGPLPWRVFAFAGSLLAVREWCTITGVDWRSAPGVWALATVTVVLWRPEWLTPPWLPFWVMGTLAIPVLLRNRTAAGQMSMLWTGALYIGFGGSSLAALRDLGIGWLVLPLVTIWATDTTAYFAGSSLQGPKLWPDISPKKTISGAVAGLAGGAAAAALVGAVAFQEVPWWTFLWIGAVVSAAGQVGDLVESACKRAAGVKDSGHLLPGHGGVLDRVDSLLLASPVALCVLTRVIH